MYSVLFICTANVCRSPMALGLFRLLTAPEGDQWRVSSAGTWAADGWQAAPKTRQVLQARGLDLSNHRSRTITGEIMGAHSLILVMERGHKEALGIEYPRMRQKIYLLSEMIGQRFEIPDPMGGSLEEFEDTAREIETILRQGLDRIRQLARDAEPG